MPRKTRVGVSIRRARPNTGCAWTEIAFLRETPSNLVGSISKKGRVVKTKDITMKDLFSVIEDMQTEIEILQLEKNVMATEWATFVMDHMADNEPVELKKKK
jgi:hypothetical protein